MNNRTTRGCVVNELEKGIDNIGYFENKNYIRGKRIVIKE